MSTEPILTDPFQEHMRKKYFPRVAWTEDGPVRRRYLTKAESGESVIAELVRLAQAERFIEPGQEAVLGNAEACLAAFRKRTEDDTIAMVFGNGLDAHWCDLALGEPDSELWQELIVRSEEGETLIALAHARGVLRFRKAQ